MRGADPLWPLLLEAEDERFGVQLELSGGKAPVLQGERGLSRKSAGPGNASYYYSLPRIATQGRLRLGERIFTVSGASWIDREWSTGAMAADQAGWDWFALQLDDERELMLYRLRGNDGNTHPFSAGRWINADGSSRALAAEIGRASCRERV